MARFASFSEQGIPQLSKSYTNWSSYYVDESWNGKHFYFVDDGGWDAVFIPFDNVVNLPLGFTFTLVLDENAHVYLQAMDTEQTYLTPVGLGYTSSGYDLAGTTMVTVMKVDSDRWILSGYGVTQD